MYKIKASVQTILCLSTLVTVSGCSGTASTSLADKNSDSTKNESAGKAEPVVDSENKESADSKSKVSEVGTISMKTGQGKTMTLTMKTLPNSRDYLYCELVFDYAEKGYDLYSTSHLGEASLEWWNNLDLNEVAKKYGAVAVMKNGPQRWSMDEVGLMMSEPVPVGDSKMVFGGHLPPGTLKLSKYTVFYPKKTQNLLWKAGEPTYQLVDPDGHVYIVQGYKVSKDDLATLGAKFKNLPDGWEYRVKTLEKDLEMNLSPKAPIPSVQDEFDQIYIRIPE